MAMNVRKFLKESTAAMKEICKARYEAFGTAGNASKIKAINLEDMTARYASGWWPFLTSPEAIPEKLDYVSVLDPAISAGAKLSATVTTGHAAATAPR